MFLRVFLILLLNCASLSLGWAQTKPDEITLEPNVVQVILNDEHRNGVDWGAIVSDFHTAALTKQNDPLWNDKKDRLSFGTLSQDDYSVLLDALDVAGEVNQLPQTPIKVMVGAPATIKIDKQNIQVDVELTHLKSGDLSLRLYPHIAVPTTETWNGGTTPASIELGAETTLRVVNDQTVVIGGFMKEEVIKRTHKFPVLGNIPIVGLVFRSRGRLMQKTETVVFLTIRAKAVEAPADNEDN